MKDHDVYSVQNGFYKKKLGKCALRGVSKVIAKERTIPYEDLVNNKKKERRYIDYPFNCATSTNEEKPIILTKRKQF